MANAIHIVKQHLLSVLSVTTITLGLLFWLLFVLIIVTGKALSPSAGSRAFWLTCLDRIYHAAVRFHSFWITRVLGVDIIVHGDEPRDPAEQLIVLSNHRSWFDILVLHKLVTNRGPIVKFLIKKELIYVPVVGWLCLALNFPRLNRGKSDDGRARDYQTVLDAAESLNNEPGALLNFAEGTRFTPAKHSAQGSEYEHLLKPRSGGLRIMLGALPGARVLDCTLAYPDDRLGFWQCLGGDLRVIEVWLDSIPADEIGDVNTWLTERWRLKDERIRHASIRRAAEFAT